jgi:hypothetical protein
VTIEQAAELIEAKASGKRVPLKELGKHPKSGAQLTVHAGRYGPYVTDGDVNATLPKGTEPEDVDLETAVQLIDEKAAKGGGRKRRAAARRGLASPRRRAGDGRRSREAPGRPGREPVTVVGGGLAGCEAALQLADRGHAVRLVEMRPVRSTEAHQTDRLGELVCTNSFKSEGPENAHGQLKREMRALGSLLLRAADRTKVAAGSALAVDRHLFAEAMTEAVTSSPSIEVVREECTELPDGPPSSRRAPHVGRAVGERIEEALGDGGLAFFDAIAPIVHRDSLDDGSSSRPGASTRTPTT